MIFSQNGEVVTKTILQPIQVTGKNRNSNFFSYKIFLCFPFSHVLCLIKRQTNFDILGGRLAGCGFDFIFLGNRKICLKQIFPNFLRRFARKTST